jgi:Lar family restriction alleviation protein
MGSDHVTDPGKKVGLKPCPFCGSLGGEAVTLHYQIWCNDARHEDDEHTIWFVSCEKCGMEGPRKWSRKEAIDAWNRRHVHEA